MITPNLCSTNLGQYAGRQYIPSILAAHRMARTLGTSMAEMFAEVEGVLNN